MGAASQKRILLVEDEPTLQRILGSVLADAGHAVETVGTAEAALDRLCARDDVDLVLSDKNLPGQSGLELLAHVRTLEKAEARAIGFVLVTGYPSPESAAAVLSDGGDGYLVKPFRSLSQAVQEVDAVLADDLAARRVTQARARAVARAIAGVDNGGVAGLAVLVLIDDASLAQRVSDVLRRAGAAPFIAPQGGTAAAVCATRADQLLAAERDRADVSRVLCDVNAPFDDLVAVIARGGGTLVDASLAVGG
jgi:CheY-like chemotaxis protein